PANNFLPLQDSERVQMLLSVRDYQDDAMCVFATKKGVVKKVSLKAFSNVRSSGIIAINLVDDDELVGMQILSDADDIMLFSSIGKAIRFNVEDIRCTGRTSQGVIGMRLGDGQSVVALLGVTSSQESVFIATENGYGKRTPLADFRKIGRGGQGVIAIQCTERNGHVVGVCIPDTKQDLMLVTNAGTIIRVESSSVSSIGRNTQGVRLLQMQGDVKLVGCQVVDKQDLKETETVEEL
ncbi:MAG: DNA gyrase C-terminal beta-propeller domain-containing protein, partial [Pseudomonadota bacterium]|nr:DNA gyrase C-terminal beta-propeller domain-containing protein [Pseudomonadota bacterium]